MPTEQRLCAQDGEGGELRPHLRHGRADAARRIAWNDYGLDLTIAEAERSATASSTTYPAIRPYQLEQAHAGAATAVCVSVAGRPRRAIWEPDGELWFTDCCNYAVQASAADVLLDAMARVDRALPGTLVAQRA